MNRKTAFAITIILFVTVVITFLLIRAPDRRRITEKPNDWFFSQRAFPYQDINHEKYFQGLKQAKTLRRAGLASAQRWTLAGPTNIGGRITDLEMSPTSFDTIYAGAASGGVLRSSDGGQTWVHVFDEALSLSIGDIALDPSSSKTLYVGTGEVNGGGGSLTYGGFGLYRSRDAGETWQHLGLAETRFIGRVAIHPEDPERIYVAAMGSLFSSNQDRGLYRSSDGGQSWQQVLFLNDSTGCVDVTLNPNSPDIIYAAMWERIRRPERRSYGGPGCGIYRSIDGGESWTELTNGIPNNSSQVGRIGISISNSDPDVLYAIYADNVGFFEGVYKSEDGGDTWTRTNDGTLRTRSIYSSFGWWFGNIRVDPNDPDIAYAMGLPVYKTINGGGSWSQVFLGVHVDQHALYIHPQNSDFVITGNDGGVYKSSNGGSSWQKSPNLPITQFYTCEIDEQVPERLYGGTQDNGTNRTLTGGLDDWHRINGGDGFYVLVDPEDNRFVYAESQYGVLRRSINGGSSFSSATSGISIFEPANWNTPVVFNPGNSKSLYYGTDHLYKSVDRARSWQKISPELAEQDSPGNLVFGTTTTIVVAPSDTSVIYAGTDDGNVWIGRDNGAKWTNISGALPRRWITRVAVDPGDAEIAYVTISGYRENSFLPHIFRTTDAGNTWQDISSNLPETPLNDVIIDPDDPSILYVASDVGVFVSRASGDYWEPLGEGLPNVPVVDLDLHNPTRTLVAATYGRSMYKISIGDVSGVRAGKLESRPEDFVLQQNYPNPFNDATVIRYRLVQATTIRIEIFDVTGRSVVKLVDGPTAVGSYQVSWNGRDSQGRAVASGLYIYRLVTPERIEARRMVLAK
ncbi:T9SS type A sorting domain-containing protein [candidate division KSB1 bacterium]|nr:T9SS type A sorting domain-containing protein [candidate division KSB1 bacterium]